MTDEERIRGFLLRVVDEEANVGRSIKGILRDHVSEIIAISMAYKGLGKLFRFGGVDSLDNDVNAVMSRLRTTLYADIEERCLAVKRIAEENEDSEVDDSVMLAFLLSNIKGMTLKERIMLYAGQLRSEIEAFVSAGMYYGLSHDEILLQWQLNMRSPYGAKIVRDAMALTGFAATRIRTRGISYGRGRYISSFENLKRLGISTIGQSYNVSRQHMAKLKGAHGWRTVRGSSYPCSLCDSETGVFHPITESFFIYHPNCCCQQVFMYD